MNSFLLFGILLLVPLGEFPFHLWTSNQKFQIQPEKLFQKFSINTKLSLPTSASTNKILFDDDYILSENSNATLVKYTYPEQGNELLFRFETIQTDKIYKEFVIFKPDEFEEREPSFAMESSASNREECKQKSSEKLRDLIDLCENVVVRELTEQERKQLEKFKKEQQSRFNDS